MRSFVLLILILLASLVHGLSLVELWSYNVGGRIRALAFSSNGKLGVVSPSGNCVYIIDREGNLHSQKCNVGTVYDVSYCCNKFGFVNWDRRVYLYDLDNEEWNSIEIDLSYGQSLSLSSEGILVCGLTNCELINYDGAKVWEDQTGALRSPSHYEDLWYIPGDSYLFIVRNVDGTIVKKLRFDPFDEIISDSICRTYLAVGTSSHLYLTTISDNPLEPVVLWSVSGLLGVNDIAFSPDCKYLAVTDSYHRKLVIYDNKGDLVAEKSFNYFVDSVAWWYDRIAIGLDDGTIIVYKVEGYTPPLLTATTTETTTSTDSCPCTTVTVTSTTTYTTTVENVTKTITTTSVINNTDTTTYNTTAVSPTTIVKNVTNTTTYTTTELAPTTMVLSNTTVTTTQILTTETLIKIPAPTLIALLGGALIRRKE